MRVGTKSVLWGVHAFWWHPIVVALAWKACWKTWPNRWQWAAILCHDLGYFGCKTMDGKDGLRHPERGAALAGKLAYRLSRVIQALRGIPSLWKIDHKLLKSYRFTTALADGIRAHSLALGHSKNYVNDFWHEPSWLSALYIADKVSVLWEPSWWYLFRGWLSGELKEYVDNSPLKGESVKRWLTDYKARRKLQLEQHLKGGNTNDF